MNFRHLRSFLAVCEQGSINRAANQTGRPKAAISRSVHELELALGVKLFDHDGDTLRCNAYAQALRHRVLRAISAFSSGLCSLEEKKRKGAKVDLHIPSDLFHEAHLDALVALTETGDITLAADRLGLAVPEITRALNKMGRNLGVRLFIRNQNGLAPTVPGKLFAFHASRALDELRCIKQDLYEQRNRQIPAQVA
jgi:DNA-binding transcriptional LysR family regulator